MRIASTTLRWIENCVFATVLALIFFLVFLSDGRILNLTAIRGGDATSRGIQLFCWMMLLGFGWRITVGSWKHLRGLKRVTLMGLLIFPIFLGIFSFLPDDVPHWVGAMLAGLTGLAASLATDRILPKAVSNR
ncbi:hypothetical protein SAMN05518849_101838 [Sphingobium sp. AP50]|nr:hypothetical protein SAMN05518849_101838 [Sphingobium sp. AP50]